MLKVLVHLTQSSDATSDVDRNCLLTARKEENQIHASVQNWLVSGPTQEEDNLSIEDCLFYKFSWTIIYA